MKQFFSIFKTIFSAKKQQIAWDLLILILPLGFMTFGLGLYGLYEPHETHFAMVGREMVLRGDWITPHLNGAPYLNKPPLLYWLIAISTSIFGNTEFAVRLPVAIAGWVGLLLVWRWSRDLWGIGASRIAVLMMSVTCGWFIFTHQMLIDVILATLILGSNYLFWKFLSNPKSWVYLFSCCFCLGLGLLAKGLIAVMIPLVSWIILVAIKDKNSKFISLKSISGFLFILGLVVPWFIAVEKANPGFLHYFIVNEHLYRLLDKRFPLDYEVSKTSIGGYLGITAIWCFPWILFLPPIIKSAWEKLNPKYIKDNLIKDPKYTSAIFLLIMGFLLPILIFIPVPSRLIYYSLPSLPPFIILCAGFYREKLLEPNSESPLILKRSKNITNYLIYGAIFTLIGIGFCLVIILLPNLSAFFPIINQQPALKGFIIAISIVLTLGWLTAGIEMLQRKAQISILILGVTLGIIYLTGIIGFVGNENVRSSKNIIYIAEEKLWFHPDTLWIFEGSREVGAAAGISYYLNQGKDYNKNTIVEENTEQIPVGWKEGKEGKVYRNVLILSDGGKNRIPPKFPGKKPDYLINQQQLQDYWHSHRPVVFVTDFLRNPQDKNDPFNLNLPPGAKHPLYGIGTRRIYANQIAELIYRYNLLLRSKKR
ncbi:MAG: glycosyltransferase family 39 protein [Xenococcaceae cyanobacterium MO_188.B19]|nr:glycosyltransferase family 39 protein [Xenococcaceae cyanobacterium MO_188.B19]